MVLTLEHGLLRGKWVSEQSTQAGEYSTLEFRENYRLDYTFHDAKKEQRIFLTYRIEDNVLFTDQPRHNRQERTRFKVAEDGKLILIYGNESTSFVRA